MAKKTKEKSSTKSTIKDNFKNVATMMSDLNKQYGKKLVKSGDDIPMVQKVPYNEPMLDYVSDGGTVVGRLNEALGAEHSGKTRNSLVAMRNFQHYCFGCSTPNTLTAEWKIDKDGTPKNISCECTNCNNPITSVQVMVDIEGTTDPIFMKNFGIDTNGVIYTRPDIPSQAVGIVDAFLRMPEIGLILVDSVGSMGSDKEVNTAIEDDKMNQNALFLNKATRKWQMALNSNTNVTGKENGTTMIVVNQSYVTLSIFSKEVAQGGRGLRHGKATSLKTRIKEKNIDPSTKQVVGVHVAMKNEKNKAGIPYRKGEYYLNLDPSHPTIPYCHTNVVLQYIELGIDFGIIEQRGGWFYFEDDKWQGKANLMDAFNDKIKEAVDEKLYRRS